MKEAQFELTPEQQQQSVLWLSTVSFTLMFAVWLMFGVLGVPIRKEFGLSDLQFAWLTALPVLNGAIWRLSFGILADRFGGKKVLVALMLCTAIPTFLVSFVHSYPLLLVTAFLIGLAGNSFSVGVSWVSAWFPRDRQGLALGIFGAGNVGASLTKLLAPALLAALPVAGVLGLVGWRVIPPVYALLLIAFAAATWLYSPETERKPGQGRPLSELLAPLKKLQVWRFSLYYVVVFGAYVALSSWLPKYFVDTYGVTLTTAGLITALFIFPASLLRPVGGYLSDRYGARGLMYATFVVMLAACLGLGLLPLGLWAFTALLIVVGLAMGIGKAAVFRFVPTWYPREVGSVGGLVGALGALGGFFLPLMFAQVKALTHNPQSIFLVLAVFTLASLAWLHGSVLLIRRGKLVPA